VNRRNLITLLGGAAVAWPLAARAQQPDRVRRIGMLMGFAESDLEGQAYVAAFREGLQKLGWAENRNMRIDTRWSPPPDEATIREGTRRATARPHSFAQHTHHCGAAATNAHHSHHFRDRCRSGRQRLRRELSAAGRQRHRVARVAMLFNPTTATYAEIYLNPLKAAAASFAVEAIAAPVHDTSELEAVVAAHAREPNGGLIVMPDGFLNAHRAEVTSLAARYRLPAVYQYRYYTELGGLLSYGNDPLDNCRRAASYADRILKGAKPNELPVQAPVKFELVINLKTAKALSLEVSPQLLARADEVID
jgi:putative ABC transport system substrate-binding protein